MGLCKPLSAACMSESGVGSSPYFKPWGPLITCTCSDTVTIPGGPSTFSNMTQLKSFPGITKAPVLSMTFSSQPVTGKMKSNLEDCGDGDSGGW